MTNRTPWLQCAVACFVFVGAVWPSEVYFSPREGVRDQIIKRINLSKSTIDVAMYSFTSGEIAQALVNASSRGVRVRVIRDASQSSDKNDENVYLRDNGVDVVIRSGRGRGIMHNKFAIFDGVKIFTGSYNWTENAEKYNWENALFIDDPKLATAFKKEFEAIWNSPPRHIKTHAPRKVHIH